MHNFSDIDEEMKTVGSFGIDEVVGGVVRCIHAISSDCDLPTKLPQNMAQRFRTAATIAQAVKVSVLQYGYTETGKYLPNRNCFISITFPELQCLNCVLLSLHFFIVYFSYRKLDTLETLATSPSCIQVKLTLGGYLCS